jgi:hypothetical protein
MAPVRLSQFAATDRFRRQNGRQYTDTTPSKDIR